VSKEKGGWNIVLLYFTLYCTSFLHLHFPSLHFTYPPPPTPRGFSHRPNTGKRGYEYEYEYEYGEEHVLYCAVLLHVDVTHTYTHTRYRALHEKRGNLCIYAHIHKYTRILKC